MPNSILDEAIIFACGRHAGSIRKGALQAYIFHPIEVMSITSMMTTDLEILMGAILHDTMEDAGVKKEELVARFGQRVADIVANDSENKRNGISKVDSWIDRKKEAIEAIGNSKDIGTRIVCLADKVSNLRSFHLMLLKEGENTWSHFNQKDPLKHYWYYESLREIFEKELSDKAVYKEYCFLIHEIFDKYLKEKNDE